MALAVGAFALGATACTGDIGGDRFLGDGGGSAIVAGATGSSGNATASSGTSGASSGTGGASSSGSGASSTGSAESSSATTGSSSGTGGAGSTGSGGGSSTSTASASTAGSGGAPAGDCTVLGAEIVALVNDYRADNGLPAIALSPSLCLVADTHVHDLADNSPHTAPGGCNLHSWSDQGPWSPCCYTPDHAQAQCMWDKPAELTSYPGYGYENAASGVNTAQGALAGWQGSSAHNAVILNQDIWAAHPWSAVGASIYQGYAVLWFGEQADPGL
jgi:uncharacterized protein YkwD